MLNSVLLEKIESLRLQYGQFTEAAFWIVLWLTTSPMIMASIKTLMSSHALAFPYPWLLVGCSNLGTSLIYAALRAFPQLSRDDKIVVPWKYAAILGLFQGFEVGIGAEILHRISITLRTEIHMLCPAIMFLFVLAFGLERFDKRLVLSIVFVTAGGLLASYGTMTWEGADLVPLAMLASAMSTLRWVLTQKWLSTPGALKPSPLALASRMSPATALVGFTVAALHEKGSYSSLTDLPQPGHVALLLFAISFGVCVILIAEMRVVQLTSALLLAFMVPFHNVSVIFMDCTMRGVKVSAINWVGIILCAVASGFYSTARLEDKTRLSLQVESSNYHSTETATASAESDC